MALAAVKDEDGPEPIRFADPALYTTLELPYGASAEIRTEIGDGELRAATTRGGFRDGTGRFNGATSDAECIATFTKSWTLTDRDGHDAPITAAQASLLDEATWLVLLEHIQKASVSTNWGTLPNVSSAPSRATSRGSASRTRVQPRR